MFARRGISDQLVSDNGSQFLPNAFAQFAEEYALTHITTSLRYPQVNGEVQCPVQNVKHLVKKAQDPYRALMAYRTTPLESGSSPAELLITLESLLFQCSWTLVDITWSSSKRKMLPWKLDKRRILTRAPCKGLSDLSPGDRVWLPDQSWKDSSEQSWHPIVLCSRDPKWWAEEKYTPPEPPTWNIWSRKPRRQSSSWSSLFQH